MSLFNQGFTLADRQFSEWELLAMDMQTSNWSRNAAAAYLLKPTWSNMLKAGLSEVASQWMNPERLVMAASIGVAGISSLANVSKAAKGVGQYTKSSLKLGQEMHKAYHAGEVGKEFRLPSGKRIDFLDINNRTIYELKPFNPRAMQQGQKQLNMYMQELQTMPRFKGIQWKTVLDTY